ncbi:MAG: Mu-like prophage major head subunit gpT family protein [Pseudomonadota bacterium]
MTTIVTPQLITNLNTVFRSDFQAAYDSAKAASFWLKVASEVLSGSSSNTYGWLGDFPDLREWIGDRVLNGMKAHGYAVENREFESTVAVPRPQIEDDATGVYRPMMRSMGEAAARHPDQLIAALMKVADATLCYDGQNFFDTDHPVNAAHDGSGADTSVSNIIAGAGEKWFLLDTTRPLKPFIHQVRKRPEFVQMTGAKDSEEVFMRNRFVWGVDSRCNVGLGFWQQAVQSQATLDQDGFDAAYKMMQEFKGDGDRPLGRFPLLYLRQVYVISGISNILFSLYPTESRTWPASWHIPSIKALSA